jgi:hypothetical protein
MDNSKLELQSQQDAELKKLTEGLEKIDWNLDFGSVKIQIRAGKPTLLTVERTLKLD